MMNISDSISEMIKKDSVLFWGLSNKLFNLSQLARFIKPLVESRTKKSVQLSAILMNLSRLQKRVSKTVPRINQFKIENITTRSDLIVLTFEKYKLAKQVVNKFYNAVDEKNGYICIMEGTTEVTIIMDSKLRSLAKDMKPKKEYVGISAIGLRFSDSYVDIPGFIYTVVQQLALQNINIIEVCSTYTELIFCVEEKDARLTFNTIFDLFSKNETAQKL